MVKTGLHVKYVAENGERVHLSVQQKIQCCEFFMVCSEEDLALNTVAGKLGDSTSSLSRWMNKLPQYLFLVKQEKERFSLHPGRSTQLEVIGPELLAFIGDLREEKGYEVSRKMIVAQACRILGPECAFSCKSYAARAQSVSRWMKNNNLTLRAGTHQGQALPSTVVSLATDFIMNIACPAFSLDQPHRHQDFIINMDQTPVFFSMHPTQSVDTVGNKTIDIRITENGSQRATVAICFTASGIQLKSMIIFKGKCIMFPYYFILIYF